MSSSEEKYQKWNYDRVLILTKDGPHRQNISKLLQKAGFQTFFVGSAQEVFEQMVSAGPGIFIQDFDTFSRSQSELFAQRVGRMDDFKPVLKIILINEITPKIIALASDIEAKRVVPYSTSFDALGQELKMLASAESSLGNMQRKIRELASSGSEVSQEEADKIIEETYHKFSHDPAVKLEFAGVNFRRKELQKAEKLAKQVLTKDKNNLRALSIISRIRMYEGKLSEAIQIMELSNALAPGNVDRLLNLGEAFFKSGQNDKAKSVLQSVKSVAPDAANKADSKLGEIALSEGDMNAALDLFKNSCTEDEAAGYFNNAAVMAIKGQQHDQALKLYQTALRAIKTDRLKALVYFNIALANVDLKRYKEALKAIASALRYDENFEKAIRLKEKIDKDNVLR